MKIKVNESKQFEEIEVEINCLIKDKKVVEIINTLQLLDKSIVVKKDNENYILTPKEIYYFDCVDEKIFCYTKSYTYETSYRLYEIENFFGDDIFMRISKNMILNIYKIKGFKSQINGRLEALLLNGERVEVSRKYVKELKYRLGGNKNE